METRLVLTTAANKEEAEKIARWLVENRLAACVNLLPPMQSIYRWKEKVESSQETMLIIKTERWRLKEVQQAIGEIHSYELPEFLTLSPESGSQEYLEWIASSLR